MKILVIKGGFSREREISLRTGATFETCVKNLRHQLISFDLISADAISGDAKDPAKIFGDFLDSLEMTRGNVVDMVNLIQKEKPDLILNALHGTFGEDGAIQGFFEALGVPYSHSNVLTSALAMDKMKSKILFEHAGLTVPKGAVISIEDLKDSCPLPKPFVVKPIAEGSTFGVSVIHNDEDLKQTLSSWEFGDFALVESFIQGRELTVSILDDDILGVAEIKSQNAIYTYNDKYTKGVAERLIPAPLTPHEVETLSHSAKKAHQVLGCRGLARSDFMYDGKDFYILEVNTQPGFTQTSFATLKAKQRGWSIEELVAKIIDSVLSHHHHIQTNEKLRAFA